MQNLTFNLRREKFALLAANQMANLVLEMIELKIGTQSEASLQFYRELEHRYLSNFIRTTGYSIFAYKQQASMQYVIIDVCK